MLFSFCLSSTILEGFRHLFIHLEWEWEGGLVELNLRLLCLGILLEGDFADHLNVLVYLFTKIYFAVREFPAHINQVFVAARSTYYMPYFLNGLPESLFQAFLSNSYVVVLVKQR